MILTNTSIGDAESTVQRLQNEFRDWARNNGLPVGFSFGLEIAREGKNNLGDILRQVDAALYDAKLKNSRISQ
jgi:GGDEF domain-containing protein